MKILNRFLAVLLLAGASDLEATPSFRRFALVVGANAGGARPPLRFAVMDASRFAEVLKELGGVQGRDATVLADPTVAGLETALRSLSGAVEVARSDGGRIEVVFYYSGHADETGLLLGAGHYSYESLREQLNAVNADVRIAVLDACASGGMTRVKGGERRKAFMVDESSTMRGHAFLTSSSADESAQESDRIRGSFFTHYLVSGLRGAADISGEGKVTLNEAYQYAFGETLGRTLKTQGGPQHPSYDIDMSGTGDVVITDLRDTSSSLVLDADISGRCFVREQKAGIVIEVEKPLGRRIELGVGPGRYEVHCQDGNTARSSHFKTEEGLANVLSQNDFTKTKLDPTAARGDVGPPTPPPGMLGKNRVAFQGAIAGYHDAYRTRNGTFGSDGSIGEIVSGRSQTVFTAEMAFTRWIRPRLGLELRVHSHKSGDGSSLNVKPLWYDTTYVTGVLPGVRFELNSSTKDSTPRLYVFGGAGPFFRPPSTLVMDSASVPQRGTTTKLGASVGTGVDFRFGSHLGLGLQGTLDFIPSYTNAAGGQTSYSGATAGLSVSWFFGGSRKKPQP